MNLDFIKFRLLWMNNCMFSWNFNSLKLFIIFWKLNKIPNPKIFVFAWFLEIISKNFLNRQILLKLEALSARIIVAIFRYRIFASNRFFLFKFVFCQLFHAVYTNFKLNFVHPRCYFSVHLYLLQLDLIFPLFDKQFCFIDVMSAKRGN